MQSRNIGKKNNNLKTPSLSSDFKKSSPLIDVATTVEDDFQSRRLLKVSDFTVDAISSRKHNLQSSNLLNVSNFTVDAVSSGKDILQTAKFLSDLNEPDSFMKFAKRFVEDYMRRSNKPSDGNEQNLAIGVAPSLKHNLISPSLSNKPDSSLKYDVQLSTSTKSNLKEKKKAHKEILKVILKTNSSDEVSSDDEAYLIFNPVLFKKPPKKHANKLQPMALRIYGWHWQSEKMFEYVFPLSKHANKLISGNIFLLLILFVFSFFFFFIIVKLKNTVNSQKFMIQKSIYNLYL